MRISRIWTALAARARTSSTPARRFTQIEIELSRFPHHHLHDMQV